MREKDTSLYDYTQYKDIGGELFGLRPWCEVYILKANSVGIWCGAFPVTKEEFFNPFCVGQLLPTNPFMDNT